MTNVDLVEAIKRGMQAADDAQRATDEINATIAEVAESVEAVSDGKVTLVRTPKQRPIGTRTIVDVVTGVIQETEPYEVIQFELKSDKFNIAVLCEIELSKMGYPVTLAVPDREIFCENRGSLLTALATILAEPDAGRKLKALLGMKVGG